MKGLYHKLRSLRAYIMAFKAFDLARGSHRSFIYSSLNSFVICFSRLLVNHRCKIFMYHNFKAHLFVLMANTYCRSTGVSKI